jgi:hypothetical protein
MFRPTATPTALFDKTDDRAMVIRWASEADRGVLADLAALDSAPPLEGEALVALVDGEAWAGVSVEDGRVVADPFRPSAHAAELLSVRAGHLRAALERRRGLAGRLPRLRRAAA